jgi:hypothetical protein
MTVLLKKGKKFVLEFWLNLAVIWMLDKIFFKKFILLLIVEHSKFFPIIEDYHVVFK